jgi:hypothetical protein
VLVVYSLLDQSIDGKQPVVVEKLGATTAANIRETLGYPLKNCSYMGNFHDMLAKYLGTFTLSLRDWA